MTTNDSHRERFLMTALAAAALAAVAGGVLAQEPDGKEAKSVKGKEKCFGVAKAGENGCQASSGSHTCGGCSDADFRGEDWKWVPSGTCLKMGGQLQAFEGYGKQAGQSPMPEKK